MHAHTAARAIPACLGLLFVLGAPSPAAASSLAGPRPDWALAARAGELEFSGQLIVRPRQTLGAERDRAARARLAGRVLKYYGQTDEYIVSVDALPAGPGAGEQRLSAELLATGDYQYAHPNWICYPTKVPDDPSFENQWHHQVMQSPLAWEITTGLPTVVCAVTDSGIDITHPDLAPHRVPGFNAVTDLPETEGGEVGDLNGHGTHVAGCAAAVGNNATGVCGVGWNLEIMMVRVALNSGGGAFLDDILQGARWAIENGAKVASSSYTGVSNPAVETTGAYIKAAGGLYCYAAGNNSTNWSTFDYADVIIVGATDQDDNRASFSGYGLAVDVFAPGTDILSTCVGGGYCYSSGTSMATPIVNGLIGMIWSANPSLTNQQVEDILFASCDDIGAPGEDNVFGWGRVNTFKAVAAALAASGPVPPIAVDDNGGPALVGNPHAVDVLANDFDVNGDTVTILSFDATSAAGGAVTLSVGTGPGGRDELVYSAPSSFLGADTFTYTAQDPGALTDTATVTVQVADSSDYRDPENPPFTAPGMRADYFALTNPLALPDFPALTPFLSETVPDLAYSPTDGDFAGSGLADAVGARFTGYVTVPLTDHYTFYVESDEGSRLYIGIDVVVNNDGLHGMQEASAPISLKAGTHAITVDYFEATGSAGLIVSISGGGLSKQVVPVSMWSHGVCPADYNGDDFVDGIDYDTFVNDFEAGNPGSDFNGDGFIDGIDYDQFMIHFEAGC